MLVKGPLKIWITKQVPVYIHLQCHGVQKYFFLFSLDMQFEIKLVKKLLADVTVFTCVYLNEAHHAILCNMMWETICKGAVTNFTNTYELIIQILWKCILPSVSDDLIRSEFCTCHDSWAVVRCAKFWPDLISTIHIRATLMVTRFG